jgi:predicted Zn-ribbon and HTH transcriptional regulator
MSAPQPEPLDMPQPNWDDMSESEKLDYAHSNWTKLSATQRNEYFRLVAEKRRRLELLKQAWIQQQSESHKQVVREKLDELHTEQKTHVRISDQLVHGPRRCVDCGRPTLPHSERCYTCESD